MNLNKYGFYLNGAELLKTVTCKDAETAKSKLDFYYPVNFNIQIKFIKSIKI